ncbi:hypothetical protein PR202_ga23336 [Eleusine coracana subsp. coracana]|uniref:Neprosin PEP catalytic domain-containing protein n=1 Tax=Eleusine coracana subsp. coracana TaxID=191504 RepID=A0AAV5D3Z7_ELECO|nr:hypothetical protein PR202_ga23336 [Eleusine coracana subsp. coracana]
MLVNSGAFVDVNQGLKGIVFNDFISSPALLCSASSFKKAEQHQPRRALPPVPSSAANPFIIKTERWNTLPLKRSDEIQSYDDDPDQGTSTVTMPSLYTFLPSTLQSLGFVDEYATISPAPSMPSLITKRSKHWDNSARAPTAPAYFRNVQVVDWDNSLVPAAALRLVADHPGCYDIKGGSNRAWGNYFYYGGSGRNLHCP